MAESLVERGLDAANETMERAVEAGRKRFKHSFRSVRKYGQKSRAYADETRETLVDFVKREPLVAIAGAFIVGYVAAQLLRRIPRS